MKLLSKQYFDILAILGIYQDKNQGHLKIYTAHSFEKSINFNVLKNLKIDIQIPANYQFTHCLTITFSINS